jgi:hypothetical protein
MLRDEEVMRLLLESRGSDVQITEGVVKAAAGSRWIGGKVMRLLLDQKGDEVQITEGVLIAAAENNGCGASMMFLLDQKKDLDLIRRGYSSSRKRKERSKSDVST